MFSAKLKLTYFVLILLFSTVIGRSFYLQFIQRDKLLARSSEQTLREVRSYPERGSILDRDGEPLAINVKRYHLFTFGKDLKQFNQDLKKIKHHSKLLEKLGNLKDLYYKTKERKRFTWLGRSLELTKEEVSLIKELKSIFIEEDYRRIYPHKDLMAQVLGHVGYENEGLAGIEYSHNDFLKGKQVVKRFVRDAKGRAIKYEKVFDKARSHDLYLSIDKDLQVIVEQYLKEVTEKYSAKMSGAAVMDASTGEIWAMANYPTFNPNDYHLYDPSLRKLSFITDPIEPGSIFKTITIAYALEKQIATPEKKYFCEYGKFRVGKHLITESDNKHKPEWLTVSEILKESSNIGVTKIAFDFDRKDFLRELQETYEISKKTQVELPGESKGILDENDISDIRLSNLSFGQGVATNGLQMMRFYAAIANKGMMPIPTILKQGSGELNKNLKSKKANTKRIFSKKTAKQLEDMLIRVVEDGTGKSAKVDHYSIAGKTSTAQRPDYKGGYDGYVSGFLGYPVNVKRPFVVYVYVDYPQNEYYGSVVAAPVFKKITEAVLYKRKEYKSLVKAGSDLKNHDELRDKLKFIHSSNLKIEVVPGIMPNLIGLDKLQVKKVLSKLGNPIVSDKGHGILVKQTPLAGEAISKDTKLVLEYKVPEYE